MKYPISTRDDLLAARKHLGLTQEQLAKLLGISGAGYRVHEGKLVTKPLLALAVECLCRRNDIETHSNSQPLALRRYSGVTPEEIAAKTEARELAKMRAKAIFKAEQKAKQSPVDDNRGFTVSPKYPWEK